MSTPNVPWKLRCIETGDVYPGLEVRYRSDTGSTMEVEHDLDAARGAVTRALFDDRLGARDAVDRSGVWRFRELVLPVAPDVPVTKPEGNTNLYDAPSVAAYVGLPSFPLKHEGENPTGSFKDRGMTVGVTVARLLGMSRVACASTGNTSASMAAYAAQAGMQSYVFIPEGKIAFGKLAQALAYGATTIQIEGNFDLAMQLVQEVCDRAGIYLLNSLNPFRIEGQKAIGFELLQDLYWDVPDWIVLPGGNLGNNVAIAKGMGELHALGVIDRLPRLAVVQARGANPLFTAFTTGAPLKPLADAQTIATAIQIGNPVSWVKSLRGIAACDGVVVEVTDDDIMDAKACVDAAGIGAEPASCATVAGARQLVADGVIARDARVCGILTGHVLKDPGAVTAYHLGELEGIEARRRNAPRAAPANADAILRLIGV